MLVDSPIWNLIWRRHFKSFRFNRRDQGPRGGRGSSGGRRGSGNVGASRGGIRSDRSDRSDRPDRPRISMNSRGGSRINGNKSSFGGERLSKPRWNMASLQPFKKDFYVPHRDISRRSQIEVDQYRNDMAMTLIGNDIPSPITSFNEANFPDYVMNVIRFVSYYIFFSQKKSENNDWFCTQEARIYDSNSHSSTGLAYRSEWQRHGWDCPDWVWEDFGCKFLNVNTENILQTMK